MNQLISHTPIVIRNVLLTEIGKSEIEIWSVDRALYVKKLLEHLVIASNLECMREPLLVPFAGKETDSQGLWEPLQEAQ